MKNRHKEMGRARNMAHPITEWAQRRNIQTDFNKRITTKLLKTVWAHLVKNRPEEMARARKKADPTTERV